jgi:hypothetical protein
MNEPLTASTGDDVEGSRYVRLYRPKRRDFGKRALRPKIFVNATQGVGKL